MWVPVLCLNIHVIKDVCVYRFVLRCRTLRPKPSPSSEARQPSIYQHRGKYCVLVYLSLCSPNSIGPKTFPRSHLFYIFNPPITHWFPFISIKINLQTLKTWWICIIHHKVDTLSALFILYMYKWKPFCVTIKENT